MWSTAREIAPGDLVIVWLTRESLQPLLITPGKELNGKFGCYRHDDLVGVPYGSKIGSRNGRGFIHVLRPTPELWTMALPHRTQILYLADIAFIVSYLNIKPGSQVIEAGTGSGSFSHSVARTIGAKGHLYSYEFHEARANKARAEFGDHGLSEIITLTHRNVCKEGFTVLDQVDSVFLDLPAPWEAVTYAKKALRKDRASRICCFSPCIEQVLRTVAALNDAGFSDISMYETLLRPHEVHSVPALQPISDVSDRLKRQEERREDKRLKQIADSQSKKERFENKKRKRSLHEPEESKEEKGNVEVEVGGANDVQEPVDASEFGIEAKKLRTGDDDSSRNSVISSAVTHDGLKAEAAQDSAATRSIPPSSGNDLSMTNNREEKDESTDSVVVQEPPADPHTLLPLDPEKMVVSRVINEVRGHTSYLTFAVLLPTARACEGSRQVNAIQAKEENLHVKAENLVKTESDVIMKTVEDDV